MLKRLPLFLLPLIGLLSIGCTSWLNKNGLQGHLSPLTSVSPEDTRALNKKRENRRELAESLLNQAEERSKTVQPSMWGLNTPTGELPPLQQPIEILREPWTVLQKALVPASSTPTSSTNSIPLR